MIVRLVVATIVAWSVVLYQPWLWACTSIVVGRQASNDQSVMTSHTCDSHRTSSAVKLVPHQNHEAGSALMLTKRVDDDSGAMTRYKQLRTGPVRQVAETYGYLAPAYASMNEHQLAIGESTFGGREELQSARGLIDCQALCHLMLQRATTAREAIRVAGELLREHGWNDVGEVLTIADPQEVWQMEIIGPGQGRVGAVWAAQRIPDDHVGVVANSSRIGEIHLERPDQFMASPNVVAVARQRGYWEPDQGEPFRFNYAYDPEGRTNFASTRREWRVLSLLAPSLKLSPNRNDYPFSVKPDRAVSVAKVMELFRDTYENTDFDVVKNLVVTDEKGRSVVSPLANPFMPYGMNKLLKINGGWSWRGERHLARWYCMYATVTQSRSWLPDPVGGVVWFGYDNPAMTTYVPLFAGIKSLPADYETDGRTTGFSRKSAWWAFNRVATIAAHRWGEMRKNVAALRDPLQAKLIKGQKKLARRAARLHRQSPEQAAQLLTDYTNQACRETTDAYWDLGDQLWTKYDELW
jgi:dipeptidase